MTDLHDQARAIHRGDQLLAEIEDRATRLAHTDVPGYPTLPAVADAATSTPEFKAGVAFGAAATALVYRDHQMLASQHPPAAALSAMTGPELDAYAIAVLKAAGYRVYTVDGTDEIAYVERTGS